MAAEASGWFIGNSDETDTKVRPKGKRLKKSFLKALESKYCNHAEQETLKNVKIVFHGKPKSDDKSELGYLRNVVLTDAKISVCGLTDRTLKDVCPYVVDLDISGNLFDNWKSIFTIVSQLDNLKYLNLSRNPLKLAQESLKEWKETLPKVENLVLNCIELPWMDVLILTELFQQLKELHICANGYSEIPDCDHRGLDSVETLRLNENKLESWQHIWKLKHLPNLKCLILSGNPLQDVYFHDNDLDRQCSCNGTIGSGETNKCDLELDSKISIDDIPAKIEKSNSDIVLPKGNVINNQDDITNTQVHDQTETITDKTTYISTQNVGNTQEVKAIEKPTDDITDTREDSIPNKPADNIIEKPDLFDECKDILESLVENIGVDQTDVCCNDYTEKTIECISGKEPPSEFINDSNTLCDIPCDKERMEYLEKTNDLNEGQFKESINEKDMTDVETDSMLSGREHLQATDDKKHCPVHIEKTKPFHILENICLSETKIGKWKHLTALSAFPSLKSVRIKDVKLGARLTQEDRRKLFLPCLPNIKSLNGSEVTVTEREKGERYFLRYFCDKPQKPPIYSVLEKRHGTLTPLVDIDISRGYQEMVTLTFVYEGEAVFSETVSVRQPVGKLRLIIADKLCLYASLKSFNIYHKYCNPQHQSDLLHTGELEQLVLDTLPMSRFDIMDRDEIHVDMNDKFTYGVMQFVYIKNYLPKRKELLDDLKKL